MNFNTYAKGSINFSLACSARVWSNPIPAANILQLESDCRTKITVITF